jgi:hypothetical protein
VCFTNTPQPHDVWGGGWKYRSTFFLTSAVAGGEWSASRPGLFTPEERVVSTDWIKGWVEPRAGLDDVEWRKFLTVLGLELRPVDRPTRSQSLYRLRYPGSSCNHMMISHLNFKASHILKNTPHLPLKQYLCAKNAIPVTDRGGP